MSKTRENVQNYTSFEMVISNRRRIARYTSLRYFGQTIVVAESGNLLVGGCCAIHRWSMEQ